MLDLKDRTVTFGTGSSHPVDMYRFHSRDDLAAHLLEGLEQAVHAELEKRGPEIPKIKATDALRNSSKDLKRWEEGIDKLWAEQKSSADNAIHMATFKMNVDARAFTMASIHEGKYRSDKKYAEWEGKAHAERGAAGSSGGSSSPSSSHPAQKSSPRWLKWAGAAAGGAVALHGTVAAVAAVDKQNGERDWRKTALHAFEAVAGIAVSWVSIIGLRGHGPQR